MPRRFVISIVDDDASVRDAIAGLMRSLGFVAKAFSSGESFLKSKALHGTACLIADVQMPEMTGLELRRRLLEAGTPIPTILITAYPEERVRACAASSGVVCFLAKPFREEELLACIRSVIGGQASDAKH